MKRIIIAFHIVLAARLYAGDAGSFQLFSGPIQREDRPMAVVLKINTQTGQTWQLFDVPVKLAGSKSLTYVTAWAPVSEDLIADLQKLQGASVGPTPTPKATGP